MIGTNHLNDRIKTRRQRLGKTLDEVALDVGVSKATVSRWERGIIEEMRRDKLLALARSLRTTVDYLMGETDSPEAAPYTTELEQKLSHSVSCEYVFRLLAVYAGYDETVDEDANVTLYGNGITRNETPEMIDSVMAQVVAYFKFLLTQMS